MSATTWLVIVMFAFIAVGWVAALKHRVTVAVVCGLVGAVLGLILIVKGG